MRDEEKIANHLVDALRSVGLASQAKGRGVHWQVEVTAQSRSLLIDCFWYERSFSGLMLGMNPANARSRLPEPTQQVPYEGPEYAICVQESGAEVATGRTRELTDAVAAARFWCRGDSLEQLAIEVPFIGRQKRIMQSLAVQLNPVLYWELTSSHRLWVHSGDRACELSESEGLFCGSFRLRQAQVAYSRELSDVPAVVSAWLLEQISLESLSQIPNMQREAYAEWIEQNPSRWHWMHVRDRINDPDDVLAPLKELIAALAEHPIASKFYSFSSLNRFCFSASSHYPWVAGGLPVVAPRGDGEYMVDDVCCSLQEAIQKIEATLAVYPVEPFFGSEYHYSTEQLNLYFSALKSSLRARLMPRGAWFSVEVSHQTKKCNVSGCYTTHKEDSLEKMVFWPTLEIAATGIYRWLEGGEALETVASELNARVRVTLRERPATLVLPGK